MIDDATHRKTYHRDCRDTVYHRRQCRSCPKTILYRSRWPCWMTITGSGVCVWWLRDGKSKKKGLWELKEKNGKNDGKEITGITLHWNKYRERGAGRTIKGEGKECVRWQRGGDRYHSKWTAAPHWPVRIESLSISATEGLTELRRCRRRLAFTASSLLITYSHSLLSQSCRLSQIAQPKRIRREKLQKRRQIQTQKA